MRTVWEWPWLSIVLAVGCTAGPVVPLAAVDVPVLPPADAAVDAPPWVDAPPDVTDVTDATDGGVLFRVWAPAATAATVQGDFGSRAMTAGTGGVFTVRVPEAHGGQQYHYVLQHAGQSLTRTDPRARSVAGTDAVIPSDTPFPWQSPPFTPPPRRETVMYELHIGSFNVPTGATAGSYASVTARLPDLADLGVNAIELMPVAEFGGTGWGYNPRLWSTPNAAYGTPDDLRRLVDAAHALGIAVVLDVVYNHTTGGHAAPLYCYDGACDGTSYGPWFFPMDPYRVTPWGPRPDYTQPEVSGALVDSVGTWLSDYRMDGFRWDSVSNIRAIDGMGTTPGGRDVLLRANALSRRVRPGALLIAEDLKGDAAITRPAADGGYDFDAQWDGFVYTVGGVVAPASDDGRDMNAVAGAVTGQYNGDPFQRIIGTENHDTVGNSGARLPQRIDAMAPGGFAARKRSMLAAALALTSPGVPMLFMGQEHLEAGSFTSAPSPVDWSLATTYAPVRDFYRTMVGLRRNRGGVTAGLLGANVQVISVNDTNKVLAWRRWDHAGDDVVVIVNFRNRAYTRYDVGLPAGGVWHVRMDTDNPRWSPDFHGTAPATVTATAMAYDNQPYMGGVVLGPWSVVVLSRDPGAVP